MARHGPIRRAQVSRRPSLARLRRLWSDAMPLLDKIAQSAVFAYTSIFLIQLKVIWGMWEFRDLPSGDTAAYFIGASQWAESFSIPGFAWSPLYQIYYGSLQWVTSDVYDVTILHRVVLVLGATLLVLAVLRRLLSPGIAWVLAVWWALLPPNFDALYEVYLFAVVPAMIAVLVATSRSGPGARSAVFVILFVSAFMARNEVIVAALAWGGIWIAYEIWQRWRGKEGPSLKRLAVAFALPALLVGSLAMFALISSRDGGGINGNRQGFTMCQVYAYTFQQRNDIQKTEPYKNCEKLMESEFGQRYPTYADALQANPVAMGEHFLWNLRLLPYGIQLMLFNGTSGPRNMNPDYIPTVHSSMPVGLLSVALAAFVLAGLSLLWRQRRMWWDTWLRERSWGWVALICLGISVLVAVFLTRPRPAYMFSLTVLLLAVIGMCAIVLTRRWPKLGKVRVVLPVAALIMLIALPSYYNKDYVTPQNGTDRPLLEDFNRLDPFKEQLQGQTRIQLLSLDFPGELCSYVGRTLPCAGFPLASGLNKAGASAGVGDLIRAKNLNAIYADETIATNPAMDQLLDKLERGKWRRLLRLPGAGRVGGC